MLKTLGNIFNIEELKHINLTEDEEELSRIIDKYITEITSLSKMDDSQIKETLNELTTLVKDTPEFDFYLNNLRYIKQSYFIDKKEEESRIIDLDTIKQLRLDELIDLEDFSGNTNIEITNEKIEEMVNIKREEEEKWKDYNIISTISNIIGVQESNIEYISNLSDYISFVANLEPAVNYVSRGQKNCTYELLPSLHRKHKKDYEIHADKYEAAFKQKIVFYDREIKGISNEELRAEGQHFGLPTEYLDFTEAHLISLLFAIEDYEYAEQHSIVYFIDALSYNLETVDLKEKLINFSDSTVVESVRKFSSRSYFIKLGNSNERIHFQKGCFLKVSTQDKDDFKEKISNHGKAVIINKASKKKILKELFNLGVTFENIYPDKDNAVKSINFHYKEMQGEND
ncbi:FRG domain-containing protein [Mangrovibacillus cuniculi]|uniref:FRG domain-containing protein n=1 Tax=Mangrovibacillus cuniculi TaxID=2593652 RepID=A0A7S8HE83_9BACI|nr:FRG domain-containing protein [Mangrovibacillus cuniculi]QPC45574.1 FRG domain-containing protein [Mangrovibacillus cuniculi]